MAKKPKILQLDVLDEFDTIERITNAGTVGGSLCDLDGSFAYTASEVLWGGELEGTVLYIPGVPYKELLK